MSSDSVLNVLANTYSNNNNNISKQQEQQNYSIATHLNSFTLTTSPPTSHPTSSLTHKPYTTLSLSPPSFNPPSSSSSPASLLTPSLPPHSPPSSTSSLHAINSHQATHLNIIVTLATTMVSTSVSMATAMALALPTNLAASTATDTTTVVTTTVAANATTIATAVAAATGTSTAVAVAAAHHATNQTQTVKDELIQFNLTNETLSTHATLIHFYGEFDVSYIAKINPFWLQFAPPDAQTFFIMAIIYIIITTVGCIGNALVIYMFMRCKSLRTAANTLVINLAVSDFLMLAKCPIAIYNNFKQGPALGDAACRIYGFLGGLSGTASIGTLTAIALDRYNVVVYPLDPLRQSSKLRPQLIITLIWIYSFIFAVIPALDIGLSVYVPEGFLTTCSFDYLNKKTEARIFMFTFFVAAWCVPFITICFSYFYILKVVYAANRIQSNKDKNKTEQKLAMIVVGIIALWFLAWTPYSIVAMLGVFGKEKYLTPLMSMIPAIFCKTSACIDPYIYAATHPRFRMEIRRFFTGKGQMRRSSTIRSSYVTRSRSSTLRRFRVTSETDTRNRSSDNCAYKNNYLTVVPETTEENEEFHISVSEELRQVSDIVEQSRF